MQREELLDLLMSGVKWEINEVPITLLTQTTNAHPVNNTPNGKSALVPPIAPTQNISQQTAISMAARPGDLDALCRMIAEFNHPLRANATNVVLPSVATKPNGLVIVTDMPGTDDDATGKILSGTAGDLMDKMLSAIEMSRIEVSIVPMLFWRTPGGRTPTREEIDLSRPFLDRILEMLDPRVVLTLGSLPATELGHINIAHDHGMTIDLQNGSKLIAMYHPNYLLLKPSSKREAWTALQNAQKLLKTV